MSKLKTFSIYRKQRSLKNWLVKDIFIEGGTSLLVGDPKGGKSQFVRHLIASYLLGDEFLGKPFSNKNRNVIYLALEESPSELTAYLEGLGISESEDRLLIGDMSWIQERNLSALESDIQTFKPAFLVIDTFVAFSDMVDTNDYGKVYKALQPLSKVARENNCHIVIVHHKNKSEGGGSRAIMGSQAFFGAVDGALFLSGETENKKLEIKPRYSPSTEILFSMNPKKIENVSGVTAGISCRETILEQISLAGDCGLQAREIKGYSKAVIQKNKESLVGDGLIIEKGGQKGKPKTLFLRN